MTAMVTAGGRIFCMLDDAPPGTTGMPARWSLYARDAFNGILLWKKPLENWGWKAWSGSPTLQGKGGGRFTQPIHIPRTLVVDKDRVFVTLGYGAPVTVLDARTGKRLTQYQETENCDELVLDGGLLVAAVHEAAPEAKLSAVRSDKPVELGKRLVQETPDARPSVRSPADAANLVMYDMALLEKEELRVILLDTKNHVLGVTTVYVGNVNSSIIRVAEVFQEAVRVVAPSIIVVHNHPSGASFPSPEDVRVTERIVQAGKLIDIDVLDHIVVGKGGQFTSLKERGLGFS